MATPPVLLQSDGGVLLTTYETMRLQRADLLSVEGGYVVLDEGHKIRRGRGEGGAFAGRSGCRHWACAGETDMWAPEPVGREVGWPPRASSLPACVCCPPAGTLMLR